MAFIVFNFVRFPELNELVGERKFSGDAPSVRIRHVELSTYDGSRPARACDVSIRYTQVSAPPTLGFMLSPATAGSSGL